MNPNIVLNLALCVSVVLTIGIVISEDTGSSAVNAAVNAGLDIECSSVNFASGYEELCALAAANAGNECTKNLCENPPDALVCGENSDSTATIGDAVASVLEHMCLANQTIDWSTPSERVATGFHTVGDAVLKMIPELCGDGEDGRRLAMKQRLAEHGSASALPMAGTGMDRALRSKISTPTLFDNMPASIRHDGRLHADTVSFSLVRHKGLLQGLQYDKSKETSLIGCDADEAVRECARRTKDAYSSKVMREASGFSVKKDGANVRCMILTVGAEALFEGAMQTDFNDPSSWNSLGLDGSNDAYTYVGFVGWTKECIAKHLEIEVTGAAAATASGMNIREATNADSSVRTALGAFVAYEGAFGGSGEYDLTPLKNLPSSFEAAVEACAARRVSTSFTMVFTKSGYPSRCYFKSAFRSSLDQITDFVKFVIDPSATEFRGQNLATDGDGKVMTYVGLSCDSK